MQTHDMFGSLDLDWILIINSLDMSEQNCDEHLGDFPPYIISFIIT